MINSPLNHPDHASRAFELARAFLARDMSAALDDLSLKFVIHARTITSEVLDIGCGNGFVAKEVLARGGHILAIDPDPMQIEQLIASVPAEQRARLRVLVDELPRVDFKAARFAAVHSARVFHLLNGAAIQRSLKKFFRWLYPDGRLFLSVVTPQSLLWQPCQVEYRRRLQAGFQWPGYIEDLPKVSGEIPANATSVHLLDERTLRRELDAAGFLIEDMNCYPLPWDSSQICCGVVTRCRL